MESANANPYAFSATPILSYLDLPPDYKPSPHTTPVAFLSAHLRQLPPNLLALFSTILTPQQRTVLPIIRNRRQKYASTVPRELALPEARKRWPMLWEGREKPGLEQAKEEKRWAEREFLGGARGQVGRLGQLLSEYEEEREAERMREARRQNMMEKFAEQIIEEEEENGGGAQWAGAPVTEEQESVDQLGINFERAVREKFIYGLLDDVDYDAVDWDDKWDEVDERDTEERWFDEEEEDDAPLDTIATDY